MSWNNKEEKVKLGLKMAHLRTTFLICVLMLDSMYFKAVRLKRASLCK